MHDVNGDFGGSTNLNIPESPVEEIANFLQIDGMAGALVVGSLQSTSTVSRVVALAFSGLGLKTSG
jgi:hypothetical protein